MNEQNRAITKVVGTHALIIGGFAAAVTVLRDLAILHKKGVI